MNKKIGKILKDMRTMRQITQQELGGVLGVTFQQIQKYETGQNRIAAVSLFALLDYMKVSIAEFGEALKKE